MSNRDKLLEKIKNNPNDVRFEELCKLLERDGWQQKSTHTSSSHYVYRKEDFGRITVVKGKHGKVKTVYVKNVLEIMGV